jgi:hypothetical protein
MKKEKKWIMYCKIQALKSKEFSQRNSAKMTGYSRKAIHRYWNMTPVILIWRTTEKPSKIKEKRPQQSVYILI